MTIKITKEQKPLKPQQKQKRSKQNVKDNLKIKEHRRKNHRSKKKITIISDSETSDVSDNEYRNKRRKLENAVSLSKIKHDKTTLKDRITKMLYGSKDENPRIEVLDKISEAPEPLENAPVKTESRIEETKSLNEQTLQQINCSEAEKICTEINELNNKADEIPQDVVDTAAVETKEDSHSDADSDQDLEVLRQMALKTKSMKLAMPKKHPLENKQATLSEDEDSDTAELRMICLKSAFLKKAIEIKQKQKLQKKLSQSSISPDDFDIQNENDLNMDNNTDIESVDMDIGSDAEDKGKIINDSDHKNEIKSNNRKIENSNSKQNFAKDEIEDDEDLLRAKLLTSLSKNLPNLVDLNVLDTVLTKPDAQTEETPKVKTDQDEKKLTDQNEKKFIIQLGESDSEGENEATKNLTKMHLKLSEQQEFQNKLDLFLKSTRMEVEKSKLPDLIQKPLQKPPEKIVVKVRTKCKVCLCVRITNFKLSLFLGDESFTKIRADRVQKSCQKDGRIRKIKTS